MAVFFLVVFSLFYCILAFIFLFSARVVVNLRPSEAFACLHPLPGKCTLRQALQWYVDLTYPAKKSVLKVFTQYTADETERTQFRNLLRHDEASKVSQDCF